MRPWLFQLCAGALAFVGYLAWRVAWRRRELLIRGLPTDIQHRPADIESHGSLDRETLDKRTSEFLTLGFAKLADLETTGKTAIEIVGFDRVLVHPEHGCMAAISQLLQPLFRVECSVGSAFAGGCSYNTEDHVSTWGKWLCRSPRDFWSTCSGGSPAELLRAHIEKREWLMSRLGLRVEPVDTVSAYGSLVVQQMQRMRDSVSSTRCSAVLWDSIVFGLSPKREWMG